MQESQLPRFSQREEVFTPAPVGRIGKHSPGCRNSDGGLKSGLGNQYISQLKVWQDMLDLGLSTFPETEPNSKSIAGARSDCHVWSASVCYDFLSIICGINPAENVLKSVEIKPHPGYLTHIKVVMQHTEGLIEVDLNFREGHVTGIVTLCLTTLPVSISGRKNRSY